VSSARKKEWILPKGGWELDERMEESAVRETYEEAGILGTLGQKLNEITFETRKGKKRRLERLKQEKDTQELERECSEQVNGLCSDVQAGKNNTQRPGGEITLTKDDLKVHPMSGEMSTSCDEQTDLSERKARSNVEIHNPSNGRIEESDKSSDVSLASELNKGQFEDSSYKKPPYEMCRMTLFPLYVSDVLDIWPENGRSRKILTIDEAIEKTGRDELKTILTEVRRRNLHLAGTIAKNNGKC